MSGGSGYSGPDPVGGFGGGGNFYTGSSAPAQDPHQGQVNDGFGNWGTPQQLPEPKGGGSGQGDGQQRSAQPGGDTPAQGPGADDFGYGGNPINDSPTEQGGAPVESSDDDAERNAVAAGQAIPDYTGDQQSGSSDDDPNNVDPSIVTTDGGGDPNPDDPDGSDESPRIPGRGFHPHGGNTGGTPIGLPDPPGSSAGATGPFAGWTDTGGGDWGGNPHENPDPEDSGSNANLNAAAVAANNSNPDDLRIPNVPSGGDYGSEWGNNNPHYMPYLGPAWTPATRVSAVTKASTESRVIVRAGQLHFK